MEHQAGTDPDCPHCTSGHYQAGHTNDSECVWCATMRVALQKHKLPPEFIEGILKGSRNYFEFSRWITLGKV